MNEDINFEDAMKQLESIANELEKGNLTLDESVKKFEEDTSSSSAAKPRYWAWIKPKPGC